jgi:hypothetical protein
LTSASLVQLGFMSTRTVPTLLQQDRTGQEWNTIKDSHPYCGHGHGQRHMRDHPEPIAMLATRCVTGEGGGGATQANRGREHERDAPCSVLGQGFLSLGFVDLSVPIRVKLFELWRCRLCRLLPRRCLLLTAHPRTHTHTVSHICEYRDQRSEECAAEGGVGWRMAECG